MMWVLLNNFFFLSFSVPVAFTGGIDEESHALGDGEVVVGYAHYMCCIGSRGCIIHADGGTVMKCGSQ